MDSNKPLIHIEPSDRVLIIGTTGSGKSYLTRKVLLPRFAVRPVVLDPKERWEDEPAKARIVHSYNPRVLYQVIRVPDYAEANGPAIWDEQVARILRGAPHTIIADETNLITHAQAFPPSTARVVRTGRDTKRGPVGLWMLTQQPSHIPTSAFAQSQHKFIFMLEREQDYERVRKETCREVAEYLPLLKRFDYIYWNKERDLMVPVWNVKREAA